MTKNNLKLLSTAACLSMIMISAHSVAQHAEAGIDGERAFAQSRTSTTTTTVEQVTDAAATPPAIAPTQTETETTVTAIHRQTTETILLPVDTKLVVFKDLDTNADGILDRAEVGKKLFKLYDTDGNQIIDNIEHERKAVITVQPIERETVTTYNYNGTGAPEKTEVSKEQFMRETMLSHFDKNNNGLSPHEFIDRDFMAADVNNDHAIELKEWQGAYDARLDKRNKEAAAYNN